MADISIGEQELTLLRHVADAGCCTVGEVAETFGRDRTLARSTILTMMERMRRKGHLVRKSDHGVFRYRARVSSAELLQGAVGRFVERHLGGSVSPFAAYLSDATDLSDDDLKELSDVVSRLRSSRKKARS